MKTARHDSPRRPTFRNRRSGFAAAALALVVAATHAGPAAAHRRQPDTDWTRTSRAAGRLVEVTVLVDGKQVPLYSTSSLADRRYFEAERGRNYALAIRNRTNRRIAVLLAVDGINVVNGERSHLGRHEPMYVLDPHASATIRGWRTSLQKVRQFVFVDEERSYANRTDQANGDMGWIRVLAFEEERPLAVCPPPPPWRWYDVPGGGPADAERRESAARRQSKQSGELVADEVASGEAAAPSAGASKAMPSPLQKGTPSEAYPGTGWGSERRDVVREVDFAPAVAAVDHLVLRYEYASGLIALGIFTDGDRLRDRDRGEMSFARPPRW